MTLGADVGFLTPIPIFAAVVTYTFCSDADPCNMSSDFSGNSTLVFANGLSYFGEILPGIEHLFNVLSIL